jgi:hypothetical protein
MAAELRHQKESEERLHREGGVLAAADFEKISARLEAVASASPDLSFGRHGQDCSVMADGFGVHVHLHNPFTNTSEHTLLELRLMEGAPFTGYNKPPKELRTRTFTYGLTRDGHACWTERGRAGYSNEELAGEAVHALLERVLSVRGRR